MPSIRGKEQTGAMTEILANGLLKKAFADKLKGIQHHSVDTDRRNDSFDKSRDFGGRSLTEDRREQGSVRIERLAYPGDAIAGSISRDGSPTPQHAGYATLKTEGDRKDTQKSRQVLRINSNQSNGISIKNPLTVTKSKGLKDVDKEKQKLTINTTWDGNELSRENSKEMSRRSISRQSVSLSKKGPSTPSNQTTGSKQLINIKSMIKHIITTGEKAVGTNKTDRSVERADKTNKPAFFSQISNNVPIKLKTSIPRDSSFSSQYQNQSVVRSLISPKSPVIPSKSIFQTKFSVLTV